MHARLHKLNVLGDSVFEPGDPPGHDDLELYFSAGGPVAIDTKYGNDEVRISNLPNAAVTTNAKATLTVNTGSGDDRVSVVLGGLTTNGLVRLGAALRIETGDGQDRVLVSDVEQATVVTVNTGRGNDNIWVQSSPVVFPKLSVWAGEGDDRLVLHGIKSTRTVLGGGDGTDTLETFQNYPSELGDATISGFEVFENNPV
jgi:hypothetical protein